MWLFKKREYPGDEELVLDYFTTGNKASLGYLFEKHVKTVFGTCLFYFRDKEIAKDAVMQIFEKLLVELRKTDVKNFKAWLGFVVRNHCISELRKDKNIHFLPETYLDFEIKESNLEEEEKIARVNNELMMEHMKTVLPQLKDQQRSCVELFYLKGLSYEEISVKTKFSINEIKSFIQNGKRNLKLMIEEKIKNKNNGT